MKYHIRENGICIFNSRIEFLSAILFALFVYFVISKEWRAKMNTARESIPKFGKFLGRHKKAGEATASMVSWILPLLVGTFPSAYEAKMGRTFLRKSKIDVSVRQFISLLTSSLNSLQVHNIEIIPKQVILSNGR